MKHTPQSDSERTSAPELPPYRRARAFGYTVINALLEGKFAAGIQDVAHFEQVIQDHLAMEPNKIAPWHRSPLAQSACRDGMRLAALNFYWEHRDAIQVLLLAASFGDEIALAYRATAGQSEEYMLRRPARAGINSTRFLTHASPRTTQILMRMGRSTSRARRRPLSGRTGFSGRSCRSTTPVGRSSRSS
jgi:hypothetical protein